MPRKRRTRVHRLDEWVAQLCSDGLEAWLDDFLPRQSAAGSNFQPVRKDLLNALAFKAISREQFLLLVIVEAFQAVSPHTPVQVLVRYADMARILSISEQEVIQLIVGMSAYDYIHTQHVKDEEHGPVVGVLTYSTFGTADESYARP